MSKKQNEIRMSFAMEKAATAWCTEKTSKIDMIPELAKAFANILIDHMYAPHLGCATTRELFEEIKTRIELNGNLDYRTIDSD